MAATSDDVKKLAAKQPKNLAKLEAKISQLMNLENGGEGALPPLGEEEKTCLFSLMQMLQAKEEQRERGPAYVPRPMNDMD